ncbi:MULTISPECIES: hypothetical protein [Clostridium]|uniref:hypothetical protein n=1 Tax=Clostridium TaxID=1485 RepID=UPI0008249CC7|nr:MULTISPECIES: hypothetical protein [Clostridium]PJI09604.1 hypothetical protein CUB90_17780 [Clostridium sp. CT7]
MNKLRKAICIFVSLIIILTLFGCETDKDTAKDFKEYTKAKYAMNFKIKSISQGSSFFGEGSYPDECVIYSENNPSKKFTITKNHCYFGKSTTYNDGYFASLVSNLVSERIKGIMGDNFKDFKYYVDISSDIIKKDNDMSFDLNSAISNQKEMTINLYVLVNSGENFDKNQMNSRVYQFMNELENSNLINKGNHHINIYFHFYSVTNEVFNKTNPKILKHGAK